MVGPCLQEQPGLLTPSCILHFAVWFAVLPTKEAESVSHHQPQEALKTALSRLYLCSLKNDYRG